MTEMTALEKKWADEAAALRPGRHLGGAHGPARARRAATHEPRSALARATRKA